MQRHLLKIVKIMVLITLSNISKNKIIGILLCIQLIIIGIPVVGTTEVLINREIYAIKGNSLEDGWIEENDGVTILHLNGSNYEMGYQHGFLLKDEIKENMRMITLFFEKRGYSYNVVLEIWDVMKGFLPQQYKDEMQGMADGSGVSFEEIAVYNTWPAVVNHIFVSCCGAAIWGSATVDDKLYHMRSLDILQPGLGIKDPETETTFRENQVLIVRKPDNGYASIYPASAGAVYSWGGLNEEGIAISANTCLTYDSTFLGISAAFRMRMVLDYADTAEEVINIINSNRTCGWNFIISDGKVPIGYVIEQTANLLYVGTWFHPVESADPFWQIEDVVRRTPMFISPACAATDPQRKLYNPGGLRGFLFFLMGKNLYFTVWTKYKALSKEFENQWGTLDLNSTISLLRNVYLGKTDFLFSIFQRSKSYCYKSLHQWVACPKTGDIIISFADVDHETACENPVHFFKMSELLDAEPP